MMTRSGSGSSSNEDIQEGSFCREMENLGCHILDGPTIHGSKRIVKAFEGWPGEGKTSRIGWKVSRKEASELRCLIVKDIFEALDDTVEEISEAHSIRSFLLQILGVVCPDYLTRR